MKQILLMIAMAPSPDQIAGIIFMLLFYLCVGLCLLGGLVFLIISIVRFVAEKAQGADPVPPPVITPPEEKESE